MLPDRILNPGPLTYESGALPIALRGPAILKRDFFGGWGNIVLEGKIPHTLEFRKTWIIWGHSRIYRLKNTEKNGRYLTLIFNSIS